MLSNLPKVTHLVGSRARIHTPGLHSQLLVIIHSALLLLLLFTPRSVEHQAPLSSTISRSLLKFMSFELEMPSSHFILCRPLLLLPSIFPSIRVFSNESSLHIRWPKYWSFSFSICTVCTDIFQPVTQPLITT